MVRRSRLWSSLAVVGSVTLAAFARPAILRLGQNRPRFVYAGTPLVPSAYDALASRPGWQKTALLVAPGVSLNGLVRPAQRREDAPWVLFFPGNDASQLTAGQQLLERLSEGRDWGLMVYAYRGFDSSGGRPSSETLREDGYKILSALFSRAQVSPSRVHVVAFSLGGYVAAAAIGRAAREEKKVASLSTLAAVENMEMIHSKWQGRIAVGDIIETLPLLEDVPGPVLVLHGGADETLPVTQGRSIAARLGSRAQFRELPHVGHEAINESPEAIQAIRATVEGLAVR
jgi:pimeloyl-ACP methyl ester carboxylesterase